MGTGKDDEVRAAVRERYGQIAARGAGSGCQPGCCDPAAGPGVQIGRAREAAEQAPGGAGPGLGCGDPVALGELRAGETVVDLGCGGGRDCLLAARLVGPTGHVIGVDMTPEMVAKARVHGRAAGLGQVEFRLGEIEHLPVADASVDVILSNCVLNLSPDKAAVFQEAFRVLKAGGRLAISDVVETAPMPAALRDDPAALVACLAGAASTEEVSALLRRAGFEEVRVEVDPASRDVIRGWRPGSGAEAFVAAASITARKPRGR